MASTIAIWLDSRCSLRAAVGASWWRPSVKITTLSAASGRSRHGEPKHQGYPLSRLRNGCLARWKIWEAIARVCCSRHMASRAQAQPAARGLRFVVGGGDCCAPVLTGQVETSRSTRSP